MERDPRTSGALGRKRCTGGFQGPVRWRRSPHPGPAKPGPRSTAAGFDDRQLQLPAHWHDPPDWHPQPQPDPQPQAPTMGSRAGASEVDSSGELSGVGDCVMRAFPLPSRHKPPSPGQARGGRVSNGWTGSTQRLADLGKPGRPGSERVWNLLSTPERLGCWSWCRADIRGQRRAGVAGLPGRCPQRPSVLGLPYVSRLCLEHLSLGRLAWSDLLGATCLGRPVLKASVWFAILSFHRIPGVPSASTARW